MIVGFGIVSGTLAVTSGFQCNPLMAFGLLGWAVGFASALILRSGAGPAAMGFMCGFSAWKQFGIGACFLYILGFGIGLLRLELLVERAILGPSELLFQNGRWRRHPFLRFRGTLTPFRRMRQFICGVFELAPATGRRLIFRLIKQGGIDRLIAEWAWNIITVRKAANLHDLTELSAAFVDLRIPTTRPDYEDTLAYEKRQSVKNRIQELAKLIAIRQGQAHAATTSIVMRAAIEAAQDAVANFRISAGELIPELAKEFTKASDCWHATLQRQFEARAREVPLVFTAELDLNPVLQAFVRRDALLAELEKFLLHPSGGGGVLLYARRRMGKSSILKNLTALLPGSLSVAYVSLQSAEANTSAAHFARRVSEVILAACPAAAGLTAPEDLAGLARFLRQTDAALETAGRRLLIGLDEYEVLDERIGQRALPEDVLALMRDAIQQHRRIRWLVSGVHHFGDLPHARWGSYLTAFQVVEVHPFSLNETHQLLTDPLRHAAAFSGRTPPDAGFFHDFWHPGAVGRIHAESQGWPALAQGIAREVVRLCHRTQALKSTPEMLEQALHEVLESMAGTLSELLLQGVPSSDETRTLEQSAGTYLAAYRTCETQPAPTDDRLRKLLTRHELIADPKAPTWHLRVPLMLRYLRERG
jgi:hypothetical protein